MASSILSGMEWDEGIALPVSNEENKQLERELMQLQADLQQDTNISEDLDDRIHQMKSHMKNVKQELKHNIELMNAHMKEVESENHLRLLYERENGRLKQDDIKLKNEFSTCRETRNNLENKIFTLNQQIEDLNKQMNWDQQALEAWLEESARRDEDAITLQIYSNQDESKLKSLSLLVDKLTTECQKKRFNLDQETTETISAQISLDKAAEDFRKTHNERKNLICEWEKTIQQMQKRDAEMDAAASDLANVKEEVRCREKQIKAKQSFLEKETLNNEEMERKISFEERLAAKLRLDLHNHETIRSQLQDELDTLRFTVERTASDLEALKSTINIMKKDINDKKQKFERSIKVRKDLQDKLCEAGQAKFSAEEKSAIAQKVFESEENELIKMERLLQDRRNQYFRARQAVQDMLHDEKTFSAELQGSRAANRNLGSRLKKYDQQSIRQQEIVYNQDFTLQQLQRRLSRLEGEVNFDERKELEAKISILTDVLEDKQQAYTMLLTQLKYIRDQNRQFGKAIEKINREKSSLTTKIEELELHNDISLKLKKKLVGEKHNLMVDNNILKLEVNRIQDIFEDKADEVISLEKANLKLRTAMKERKHEVNLHKEMMFRQIKMIEEERLTVSTELHQRTDKINKLKKRYEIFVVSMSPPEDEDVHSAAYYVIKAAQQKEELQRTGDDLDAKIRKAEKEIRALENTLKLVNSRNSTFRQNFNMITETSEEYEKKSQLEEKFRSVMDTYKYKRRQIRELQEDLQTLSGVMDTSLRDESAYQEMMQDRINKSKQLTKDLKGQEEKLDRVNKQIGKYTREIRLKQRVQSPTFEERDIDMRELRERNRQLNKYIAEVIQEFPDIQNTIDIYFQQVGLPTPINIGSGSSRGSSRSSSLQSSVRSSPRSTISSSRIPASPKAVDLGIGLKISSPPGSRQGSDCSSVRSITSSRSSRR